MALLEVRDLRTHYVTKHAVTRAVDGVDLTIGAGENVGVVGESGSGKSTLGRSMLRLVDGRRARIVAGSVRFEGVDLLRLSRRQLDRVRGGRIGVVFQNAQSALNPVFTIGNQIAESLRAHTELTRPQIRRRTTELLAQVGVPDPDLRRGQFPHELSGGLQQRVAIAIALACGPRLLIADEPTTALDVTIQAQILALLTQIGRETGMGVLVISHNLGVIAQVCTRTLVMYGGVVMEEGPTDDLFDTPRHPYTQGLLRSVASVDSVQERLYTIPGAVRRLTTPTSAGPVPACRFAARCEHVVQRCRTAEPPLLTEPDGRRVRCWLSGAAREAEHAGA
ncbi:ABC transporter ATP-binding protein [Dactylosporangium sp. CA-233914]|uniref:ABC transporter ATP-binding protein n=1 Tax=Dactylosporangium sp. CA-233914 TaxID=3239934 RepID=UPI003D8F11CC